MKFFITFGQESLHRDGWIELYANNAIEARIYCAQNFKDQHWCGTYPEGTWNEEEIFKFFPAGKIKEIKING